MLENCNDNHNSSPGASINKGISYKRTVFALPTEFPVSQIYLESYKEGRLRLGVISSTGGGQLFNIDREDVYWTIKKNLSTVFEIIYLTIVDSLYITDRFQRYLEQTDYERFAELIEDIIDYKMCEGQDRGGKIPEEDRLKPKVKASLIYRKSMGWTTGFLQRLRDHAKQPYIIEAYLDFFRQNYDYFPPEILQAYGNLRGITFHFWRKNRNDHFQPHESFPLENPSRNQPNINLLYDENDKCIQLNDTHLNKNLINNTSFLSKLLQDIIGFKLQDHIIYFDFDFRFIREIESIILTIFSRLQAININMHVGMHFVHYLYEFHDDFLRSFPEANHFSHLTTEVTYYHYEKHITHYKQTVWQPNNDDSKLSTINFDVREDGAAELLIVAKTILHYGFIRDAFKTILWSKNDKGDSNYYGYISYFFNVKKTHSKNEIQLVFEQIFQRLINDFKVSEITKKDFLKALEEYFSLNNNELSDKKPSPFYRTEYRLSGNRIGNSRKDIRPTPERMYLAAFNAKPKILLHFLRQGLSPNFIYDDHSLLSALITYGPNHGKSSEDILDSMKILIDYGVDPNQKTLEGSYQKQLVTWLARNSRETLAQSNTKNSPPYDPKKWKLRLEMLAMLMCVPRLKIDMTDIHFDFMPTAYAQIIEQGNYLIRKKPIEHSINNIIVKANSKIMIETTDNNLIEIEVRYSSLKLPLQLASKDEVERLFKLLQQSFPWVKEETLRKILAYALTVKTGTLYLDLIRSREHKDEIMGFNITEVVDKNPDGSPILIDGKPAIIHHLRLSVCLLGYKQLMNFVQYQRGFAVDSREKRLNSNRPTVTTLDLVSFYALMQLKKFASYPRIKSLEELIPIIDQAVYDGEIFKAENGFYYFDDEGLAKELGKPKSFIKELRACYVDSYVGYANKFSNLQNKASKEFYEKFFLGNGSSGSIMGVFHNNPSTFFRFLETLSEATTRDLPLEKICRNMESTLEPINPSTTTAKN